jgi:hypothetical protein
MTNSRDLTAVQFAEEHRGKSNDGRGCPAGASTIREQSGREGLFREWIIKTPSTSHQKVPESPLL